MAAYDIRFSASDFDEKTIVGALDGLAAELPRRSGEAPLRLSVRSRHGVITHRAEASSSVLRRLRSTLPNVRFSDVETDGPRMTPSLVGELRISTTHRPLRSDLAAVSSASLLGALTGVGRDESAEVVWLLAAARRQAPARLDAHPEHRLAAAVMPRPNTWHTQRDAVSAERAKQAHAQFNAVLRIAVKAADLERSRMLVFSLLRALSTSAAPGVHLRLRTLPQWWAKRRYARDASPTWEWPILINSAELAGLIGWPIGSPKIPGLELGSAQLLPVPRSVSRSPKQGAQIGVSNFNSSASTPVVIRDTDRLMHGLVLGPTGSGKSELLAHMAASDIERGHGLVLVDPKGDLADHVADRIPEERHGDVIYFDPNDPAPVGYNPLATGPGHLVVDQIDHIFSQLFGSNYGPRSGDINRSALLTLIQARSGDELFTLAELPALLSNRAFRRRLVGRLDDPGLIDFWRWYEGLGNAQSATVAPLMNKLRALLLREPVRNTLAQPDPGWSFNSVIHERKILLVRLSPGEIGAEAAQLLGSLLVAGLWRAAQARSAVAKDQRRPVMLIVDEWQNFIRIPTGIGDMLAQARGLGLGVTLANQTLGQLTPRLQSDVLANARSKIVFQTPASDARHLAAAMPGLRAEDLQHLGEFEVFAQLAVGSTTAPSLSATTLAPSPSAGHLEIIRESSRTRYGTPAQQVLDGLSKRRRDHTHESDQLGEVDLPESDEVAP